MDELLKSFWLEHQPSLWDMVVFENGAVSDVASSLLSTKRFPFRCRYRGSVGMKVDRKEAADRSGGATQSFGRAAANVEFTLLLYEPEHLVLYATFMRVLRAGRKQLPAPAITVRHPALNVLGIERLIFKSATLPSSSNAGAVMTSTLSFVEDLRAAPVNAESGTQAQPTPITMNVPKPSETVTDNPVGLA